MKPFQLAAAIVFLAHSLCAADLTGRWVATIQTPDGQKRQTIFALKSDGATLTGYLDTMTPEPITEGRIEGNAVSFAVVRDFGAQRRVQYKGTLTPDGLLMQMPGFGGGPPREVLAKRVSTEAPKPIPPKLVLPKPQDVPPNGLAKTPPMGWNSW